MKEKKFAQTMVLFSYEGMTDHFGSGLYPMAALHSKNNFDGISSY